MEKSERIIFTIEIRRTGHKMFTLFFWKKILIKAIGAILLCCTAKIVVFYREHIFEKGFKAALKRFGAGILFVVVGMLAMACIGGVIC